jgi:hypothetical protein
LKIDFNKESFQIFGNFPEFNISLKSLVKSSAKVLDVTQVSHQNNYKITIKNY